LDIDFFHDFVGDEDISNGDKPSANRPTFRVVETVFFLMEIVICGLEPAQEENDGCYECDSAKESNYILGVYIGKTGNAAGDALSRHCFQKATLYAGRHKRCDIERKGYPDEQDGVFGVGGVGFHGNAERVEGWEVSGDRGSRKERREERMRGAESGWFFKWSGFTHFSDE